MDRSPWYTSGGTGQAHGLMHHYYTSGFVLNNSSACFVELGDQLNTDGCWTIS
jgi:hypothetical protein